VALAVVVVISMIAATILDPGVLRPDPKYDMIYML